MMRFIKLITFSFYLLLGVGAVVAQTVPAGFNNFPYSAEYIKVKPSYLRTTIPNYGYKSASSLSSASSSRYYETTSYVDGIGRTIANVIENGAGNGSEDLISIMVYDKSGNESYIYEPYAAQNSENTLFTLDKQEDFYRNASNVEHTNFAFSKHIYSTDPTNRMLESTSPGYSWSLLGGKEVTYSYRANNAGEVKALRVNSSGALYVDGDYSSGDLIVKQTENENKQDHIEYYDRENRMIILQKETVGGFNITYFVYDELGRQAYILPHDVYSEMVAQNTYTINTSNQNRVYIYKYDGEGRMTQTKIPGKDWTYFVYNTRDELVMYQNGIDRNVNGSGNNNWHVVRYDRQGNGITKGIYTIGTALSQSQMQANLDAALLGGTYTLYEKRSSSSSHYGYTNTTYPSLNAGNIYEVFYFGTYDYDNDGSNDVQFTSINVKDLTSTGSITTTNSSHRSGPVAAFPSIPTQDRVKAVYRLKNSLTGHRTKIIGTSDWITSSMFYNYRKEVIQIKRNNQIGGNDRADFYYNFRGDLAFEQHTHSSSSISSLVVCKQYEYDNVGRLLEEYQRINTEPTVRLAKYTYNRLGQVIEKDLHSENSNNFLQSVDYKYNVRGWLKEINDINLGERPAKQYDPGNVHAIVKPGGYDDRLLSVRELVFQCKKIDVGTPGEKLEIGLYKRRKVSTGGNGNNDGGNYNLELQSMREVKKIETDAAQYNELDQITSQPISLDFEHAYRETKDMDLLKEGCTQELVSQLNYYNIIRRDSRQKVIGQLQEYLALARDQFNPFQPSPGLDGKDIFAMKFDYDNGSSSTELNAAAQFDGSPSQVAWKSKLDGVRRGYGFNYDKNQRLISANYGEYSYSNAGYKDNRGNYSSSYTYDVMSNITSISRNGYQTGTGNYGVIDQLTQSYSDNKLDAVNDAALYSAGNDFKDNGTTASTGEYTYDNDGNMISDANKGINISYNFLGLTQEVDFGSGNRLEFTYNTAGELLTKEVFTGGISSLTIDYVDGMEYENGVLSSIKTDHGRAVSDGTKYLYEYHYLDHLGSIRLAFSDLDGNGSIDSDDEIIQENHYYPFGLELTGLSTPQIGPENQYKYTGVLHNSDFDLNQYTFMYRQYDPQVGRFNSVDPLAAKYPGLTPYHYVAGNPMIFIDPDGRDIRKVVKESYDGAAPTTAHDLGRTSWGVQLTAQYNTRTNQFDVNVNINITYSHVLRANSIRLADTELERDNPGITHEVRAHEEGHSDQVFEGAVQDVTISANGKSYTGRADEILTNLNNDLEAKLTTDFNAKNQAGDFKSQEEADAFVKSRQAQNGQIIQNALYSIENKVQTNVNNNYNSYNKVQRENDANARASRRVTLQYAGGARKPIKYNGGVLKFTK